MPGSNPRKNRNFTAAAWESVLTWRTLSDHERASIKASKNDPDREKLRLAGSYYDRHEVKKNGWIYGEADNGMEVSETGLGWKFRARIIWHLFEEISTYPGLEIKDLQDLVRDHDDQVTSVTRSAASSGPKPEAIRLDYLCDLGYPGKPAMYERSFNALLRCAFDTFVQKANEKLDFETFVKRCKETPLTDRDAPAQFQRLLSRGFVDIQSQFDIKPERNLYSLDLRQPALDALATFLRKSDYRPVQTVHSKNNRSALTAIADRIHRIGVEYQTKSDDGDLVAKTYLLAGDQRPCLYLRASRVSKERPVTLPQLVGKLKAFYLGEAVETAPTPTSHAEYLSALKFVRSAVMQTPAIIVFDGHRSPRGWPTALPSLISDDGLSTLLRDLLTPRLSQRDAQLDVRAFYKTRILVLTDDEFSEDGEGKKPPLQVHPLQQQKPINIVAPDPDDIPQLIDDHKWQNKTSLKSIAQSRSASFVDGAVLRLTDTWLTVVGHTYNLERDRNSALNSLLGNSSRDLADAMNEHLLENKPSAFLLLRWIALAESEIRASTLARLLTSWNYLAAKRSKRQGQSGIAQAKAVPTKDIVKLLEPFDSILTYGPDESMDGLDGPYFPPIERIPIARKKSSPIPAYRRTRSYSFVTNQICSDFLEFRRDDDALEAERLDMYRLLAEEAFRQEAAIMRHAPRAASLNVRRLRRMCEGLHYGFASLPNDPSSIDQSLRVLSRSLAVNPRNAFNHLYLTFYRHVLQHAPDFALTRNLGRPAIASDLIMSAVWCGIRNPPVHRTTSLPPTNSPYLNPDLSRSESHNLPDNGIREKNTHKALAKDIYVSLIRNLINANRLDLAHSALEKAKENWTGPRANGTGLDALSKVEIDLELLRTDPSRNIANIKGLFDKVLIAGPRRWRLLKYRIEKTVRWLPSRLNKAGPFEDLTNVYDFHHQLKSDIKAAAVQLTRGMSTQDIERGADLFARLAEAEAIRADSSSDNTDKIALSRFVTAWGFFHVAEVLRDQVFQTDPLGRDYLPNPHTNRVFVRVSLKLHTILRDHTRRSAPGLLLGAEGDWRGSDEGTTLKPNACSLLAQFFAYQAQKQLDLVTRFQFQFLAERPSLLMSEAAVIRTVRDAPEKALVLLGEADDLIAGNMDRPRLTFRLALERAKALRQLAKKPDEPSRQAMLLIAAATETLRLEALQQRDDEGDQRATGERLWKFVTVQQKAAVKKSIQELRKALGKELHQEDDKELEQLCNLLS
tara:strand:+ start:261522 stop:265256 length:3735 start_codon:yes stop_codon:yes gene_type:complete